MEYKQSKMENKAPQFLVGLLRWILVKFFLFLAVLLGAFAAKAQNQLMKDLKIESADSIVMDRVWKGKLGDKIPVLLRYHIYDEINYGQYGHLVVGRIAYQNTKEKTALPLLGFVSDGGYFRLGEYQKDGNISGVIYGREKNQNFEGEWSKPNTEISYNVNLTRQEQPLPAIEIKANPDSVFGSYAYRYGKRGYQGQLKLTQINPGQSTLYMFSVTNAPARNMADLVDNDTIAVTKTDFIHPVAYADDCAVHIRFFKHFVMVYYPKASPCQNAFGARATYEGFYYKVDWEIRTND